MFIERESNRLVWPSLAQPHNNDLKAKLSNGFPFIIKHTSILSMSSGNKSYIQLVDTKNNKKVNTIVKKKKCFEDWVNGDSG